MSPQLRGLIAEQMHGAWLLTTPFLAGARSKYDLASSVALAVTQQMYMPGEHVVKPGDHCRTLYVVHRGRLTRTAGVSTTLTT